MFQAPEPNPIASYARRWWWLWLIIATVVVTVVLAFLLVADRQVLPNLMVAGVIALVAIGAYLDNRAAHRRNFIATHRPRIDLVQMHLDSLVAGAPVVLRYWLINRGSTRATVIRQCHTWELRELAEPAGFPNYAGGKEEVNQKEYVGGGRRYQKQIVLPALDAHDIERCRRRKG